MADVIENKVAKSGLITLDLEELMPAWDVVGFDMADVLWQGLALKEKDFRAFVKDNDWSAYAGKQVYIHNSADAIIPTWAYMLLGAALEVHADLIVVGDELQLNLALWQRFVDNFDATQYNDQRVILKGCGSIAIPDTVYIQLSQKLVPQVKTLMFGEPCSTVPVFKKK
jgi:hypothetical protein